MSEIGYALLAVADLLEKPGAWTQRASARNFAGQEVEATSSAAMCWCICGAIDRVQMDQPDLVYEVILAPLGGDHAAIRVNDKPGATQAEIVTFLRSRAALSSAEGKS